MRRRRFLQSIAALASGVGFSSPGQAGHYGFRFTRLLYESDGGREDLRRPTKLLNSLIEYTNIRVDPNEYRLPLTDPAMLQASFCFLSGRRLVQFSAAEKRHFKAYVEHGGFVFVDDRNHDIHGLFARSFERQMIELFGADRLRKIPDSHEIYANFFRLDGPPTTSSERSGHGDGQVHRYLRAIEIDGRIRVLYSNKDYAGDWSDEFRNNRQLARDNMRFGVNMAIYSLTA